MSNIGFATMQVIPSLRGVDKALGGQLNGPLTKAGSDAGASASGSFRRKFSSGLKVTGLAAGAGLAGGIGAAFAVLKTGADEAKDASAGIAQLQAGIKSTGNVAKVTVPGMEALASSIQDYSGQTDDSIVASEQLLLTFTNIRNAAGKGNDIFNQATLATANLAAKMGGDASASAIQLGKALNDPVKGITALTRVGVSFSEGQKKQIKALVATGDTMGAQKIILKELNTEFGGAAKAAGQSVPGQLARAKRAFEDLSQGIVETLLPIALPAVSALTAGLKILAPIAQRAVQGLVAGLGGLGQKILSTFKGVDFAGFAGQVKAGIGSILPSLQQFGGQLVDLFTNHLVPLFVNFARVVVPIVIDIGKKLATIFTGSILPAFRDLVDFTSTKVVPVIATIADKLSGFLGFLASHQGAVKTFAKVALGLLAARFAALKINAAVTGIQKFGREIVSNVRSVISFAKSIGSAVSSVASFARSMLVGAANIAKQTVAFIAQKVASLAAAAAQKTLAAAQWLLNAAMDANPVGLIVAGIAALAAGVVLAYQHFKPFRDIVDAVGRAFRSAFDWIKDHWPLILGILTGPFGLAVVAIKANWDRITGFARAAFDWVKTNWPLLLAILTGPIGIAVLVIAKNWQRITDGFGAVVKFIGDKIGAVVGFFTGLRDRILGAIGDAGSWLVHIGKKIIDGLIHGISNALGGLKDILGGVAGKIVSWKGPPAKDKVLLVPVGRLIMGGLISGIDQALPAVKSKLAEVSGAFFAIQPKIAVPTVSNDPRLRFLGATPRPQVRSPKATAAATTANAKAFLAAVPKTFLRDRNAALHAIHNLFALFKARPDLARPKPAIPVVSAKRFITPQFPTVTAAPNGGRTPVPSIKVDQTIVMKHDVATPAELARSGASVAWAVRNAGRRF